MEILKNAIVGKEYVYVASFLDGFVKIGVSVDPIKRLRDIEKKNQIPVIDFIFVEGYYELESFLHKKYNKYRRYSEFFKIDFDSVVSFLSDFEFSFKRKKNIIKNEELEKSSPYQIKFENGNVITFDKFCENNRIERELMEKIEKLQRKIEICKYLFGSSHESDIVQLANMLDQFDELCVSNDNKIDVNLKSNLNQKYVDSLKAENKLLP